MAEPIIPMPTKKETQSKVPPVVEQPKQQITPKDPVQDPNKPGTIPFKFSKDGSILVSKEFLEVNRDNIKAEAQKAGYDSPAEYLRSVVTGAVGKTGKWTGKTVGEAERILWTPEQESKAAMIAKKHGMTPNEFKAIIAHESAGTMNPKVVNQIGATGLIQFVPTTAASYLLMEQRAAAISNAKTPEEKAAAEKSNPLFWQLSKENQKKAAEWGQKTMATLPIERQLDLADLYITDRSNGKKGFDNIYTAIFAGNPDVKEFKQGTEAYKYNKGLDKDKDGKITRDEWMQPVEAKTGRLQKGVEVSDEEVAKMSGRASEVLRTAKSNVQQGNTQQRNTQTSGQLPDMESLPKPQMPDESGLAKAVSALTGSAPLSGGASTPDQGKRSAGITSLASLASTQETEQDAVDGWADIAKGSIEPEVGVEVAQGEEEDDAYANIPSFLQGPLKSLTG